MSTKLRVILVNFVRLVVTGLTRGSTVVGFDVYQDTTDSVTSQTSDVAQALSVVYSSGSLQVGNESLAITEMPTVVNDGESEPVACTLCKDNEECIKTDDNTYKCSEVKSDLPLIIGLSVGIPLLLIFIVVIIVLAVCLFKHKASRRHLLRDDDVDTDPGKVQESFKGINWGYTGRARWSLNEDEYVYPPVSGSLSKPYNLNLNVPEDNVSEIDQERGTPKNSPHQKERRFPKLSWGSKKGSELNTIKTNFKIQRPQVEPSPNEVFQSPVSTEKKPQHLDF